MRDEETWRCRFSGGKAQAARRRQLDLVEHADHKSEARSLETFFERAQSLAGAPRLDDEQSRRIETQMRKPRRRRSTEFAGKSSWPAPQHPRLGDGERRGAGSCRRQSFDPAHRQACRKADCRHPIPRRGTPRRRGDAFNFMNRICFKAPWQQLVERRTAELPAQPARRSQRASILRKRRLLRRRRRPAARGMPLQAQNARAQPRDHCRFCG
jgi:hypothetical protein